MGLRVGVDVGGTFTKAVALDRDAQVVARAVVPTTHSHADGVAAGVVEVVRQIAAEQGPDAIDLVTHSTTQAVNALLEGDVVPVGILGMATAPHVGKARKRTALARIDLTDSQVLRTVHEFIDTTGGATDLPGFRRAPALTLYSGPAASVAGALRTGAIGDAVIVEVGGTSSNVAAIKGGRPVLAYVQVGRHSTAVRALDVRVAGVAGGSMLRARRRPGYGVGARRAPIAGPPHACFGSASPHPAAEA